MGKLRSNYDKSFDKLMPLHGKLTSEEDQSQLDLELQIPSAPVMVLMFFHEWPFFREPDLPCVTNQ